MSGLLPRSLTPRKREPRNRGAPAISLRNAAPLVFRWHGVRALLKNSTLRAVEAMMVRCPFGCHPELGGPWVPAFAGKTRGVGKRGPRGRGGAAATVQTSAQ